MDIDTRHQLLVDAHLPSRVVFRVQYESRKRCACGKEKHDVRAKVQPAYREDENRILGQWRMEATKRFNSRLATFEVATNHPPWKPMQRPTLAITESRHVPGLVHTLLPGRPSRPAVRATLNTKTAA
jgi:hypothetical protein